KKAARGYRFIHPERPRVLGNALDWTGVTFADMLCLLTVFDLAAAFEKIKPGLLSRYLLAAEIDLISAGGRLRCAYTIPVCAIVRTGAKPVRAPSSAGDPIARL